MKDHQENCYPLIITGTGLSWIEAWDDFYDNCEHAFKWVRGKKSWRSIPQLHRSESFDTMEINYRIMGRLISMEELPEGFPEATIRSPYKSFADLEMSDIGLATFPR